jgi:hypothetical protein
MTANSVFRTENRSCGEEVFDLNALRRKVKGRMKFDTYLIRYFF